MADKKSKEKTDPGTPKAKAEAKPKGKTKAKAKEPKVQIRMGKEPDNKTTHKIRLRTQGGWKLYLPAIEFWVPGEAKEMEVTSAQLERLEQDGRVMIGTQIDDFEAELAGIPARKARLKARGNAPDRKERTKVPDGLPQNYPGGELNRAPLPKDAKSAEELISEEKKFLESRAKRGKGKRAS